MSQHPFPASTGTIVHDSTVIVLSHGFDIALSLDPVETKRLCHNPANNPDARLLACGRQLNQQRQNQNPFVCAGIHAAFYNLDDCGRPFGDAAAPEVGPRSISTTTSIIQEYHERLENWVAHHCTR
jgi:hypothetical protein